MVDSVLQLNKNNQRGVNFEKQSEHHITFTMVFRKRLFIPLLYKI